MKGSYKYNLNNIKNPITYYLNNEVTTRSFDYKEALEIVYSVIDSLGGSYEYLDNLVDEFQQDKGIKFEEV